MSDSPINPPIPSDLTAQLSNLTPQQQAFLAGYLWAESQRGGVPAAVATNGAAPAAAPKRPITVISASATGNAAGVAKKLVAKLEAESLDVKLTSAGSYKARQLPKEDIVIIATSTQGDGEPPEEGVPLHSYLFGKKAPKLDGLSFAVVGLGDSSYPQFCQCGIDFDTKLGELGGERLLDRVDADVDYEAVTDEWIDNMVAKLKEVAGGSSAAVAAAPAQAAEAASESAFNKENPFTATLLNSHPLVTDDAGRMVNHIEIDLDGSGLQYQVGDVLGVVTNNTAEVVDEVLELNGLSGDESIEGRKGSTSIRQALTEQSDLNQLTPKFISDYASTAENKELNALLEDKEKLQSYQAWTPAVGLMRDYPQKLDAQRLFDGLKPLSPRLYSIASSQEEVGEEVHLCVARVDIEHDDKTHNGSASGLLCDRLEEGDEVQVFVEHNPRFRLPQNNDTPIIMIGPGTGIAPFRAFMQQRRADDAQGKNWLFFGNRHFRGDFLYQAEWIEYRDQGLLNDFSLAWSRDGEEKVYVQDKIRENAQQFWEWLQQGAHIYVCGDASRMAKDVEKAILDVIAEQGNKDEDDAAEYLNELREADRYQRDVY
ncbi:assimilatory sulfite reductase (NADPH) flavoprotein subunit [Pelagicoccus mobilis]|uniref:assimilatory sulfite reductase (NADPH) n=1 Tax=Pelagicoccus mobilis TaxID=415221 RepID=A0A934VNP1_9BACT|nr:assimilatory sulfite reductase (NADPH) flavoprotein subunit [Pelagicoccus mobilis]MBK1880161.1 assimilatory sulfite reductase (NADPH) flavoprotein subunit [Pelagicoccus mobilis]